MSTVNETQHISKREKFTICVLVCINLFNYMDRHCIAGVLLDVQLYFDIGDDIAGLIQTGFIIGYTVVSPVFGYLGDRFSRKLIMIFSLVLWIVMGFTNTIVHNFWLFVFTRMMVGVSEAGFTVIAPSMLADLVTKGSRTIVFAIFYFALPVGTGLGFVMSAKLNQYAGGEWWWGLRATPLLNMFCLFFIIFAIDPKHGAKDAAALGGTPAKPTSYREDLKYLFSNRSFVLITIAYTCISFVNAALSWWGPKNLGFGIVLIEGEHGTDDGSVVATLGLISIFTGIIGVAIGSSLSKILRPKYPFIDPIIIGIALFVATPFYTLSLYMSPIDMIATMVLTGLAQFAVNTNWAVVMDMLMYVVVPTRRASAKAIETFVSHVLGNSISTSLVGVISEGIQYNYDFTKWHYLKSDNTTTIDYGEVAEHFYGLQFALFGTLSLFLVGGLVFIWTAFYIVADTERAIEQSIEK